jgi:hypothetical protein
MITVRFGAELAAPAATDPAPTVATAAPEAASPAPVTDRAAPPIISGTDTTAPAPEATAADPSLTAIPE